MWLIAVLTMGLPWVVSPGTANPFLELKELCLIAGGWGLILWTVLRSPLLPSAGCRNPGFPWLGLYVLGMGLWHFHWPLLWRTPDQPNMIYNLYTWLPTVNVLMGLLLIRVLALYWLRLTLSVQQLTQWLCLSAALVAGYAILQSIGLDQWFVAAGLGKGNQWGGVYAGFGNPSYLAIYLASLAPLCCLFKAKRYILYLTLLLIALYLTHVRTAWGLFGVGMLSYGVARWWGAWKEWVQWGVFLGLVLLVGWVGWIGWHWAQGDERWAIWQQTWALLPSTMDTTRESWTGRGLGAFQFMTLTRSWIWAHNEWLQALLELGVIGTGLLLAVVGWSTRQAWRRATRSLLDAGWFGVWMTLLASSLFHFPFHRAW